MIDSSGNILLIGIGNEYRRDDGAGPATARIVSHYHLPGLIIQEHSGEGAGLMETWRGALRVIIIDAVSSGARPGTIHRLDAAMQKIPGDFFKYSTHAFSLAESVEMARTLNQLPDQLIIYGIEGEDFSSGLGLSRSVQLACQQVADRLMAELQPQEVQYA